MVVLQAVVYLMIYLMIGMGVFWVVDVWHGKLMADVWIKTDQHEASLEFRNRTMWIPKIFNMWIGLVAMVLGVVTWMLWPISAIGSAAWYKLTYEKLLRKYSI